MQDINFARILIAFVVLVFSLTVHESAHAWAARRLGDPTGWRMGRVSLRPYGFLGLYGLMLTGTLGYLVGPPFMWMLSWLL